MDTSYFGYSMKNIPIAPSNNYKYKLIEKVESVIKRMRWRACFFLRKQKAEEENDNQQKNTNKYGFKSRKCPPQIEEMKAFEHDMWTMIENLKFRNTTNGFQKKLRNDIKRINESTKTFIPADKTQNYYQLTKEEHDKILKDNVTKTYKKADKSKPNQINNEAKKLATKFNIHDRTNTMPEQQCFFSIKDHKEDFRTNPKYRLINPSKSELGKVSKIILEKINSTIKQSTNALQWQNSTSVIEWFKSIPDKRKCKFIQFDIEEFYPSISEKLLNASLKFASKYMDITKDEIEIIMHARKSLLFHSKEPWVKKNGQEDFDVTMGSFDGAEICELVGLFLLQETRKIIDKDSIGLYRDDGLAVTRDMNGHEIDLIRKKLVQLFKKHGLSIQIKCNLKSVDFLDITFNLKDESYKPFNKPNNEPLYINTESNHPPTIIKQIPESVSKRLSANSSNESIFNAAAPYYNEILEKCGYKDKLTYQKEPTIKKKRQRTRNITWFNPPFNKNVKTKVGEFFLKSVDKHFGKNSKLNKIFNRNTLKVSYSCMNNMDQIVKAHNNKVTNPIETQEKTCNCRNKQSCPLNGACQVTNIVYKAEVTNNRDSTSKKTYIGISQPTFKE